MITFTVNTAELKKYLAINVLAAGKIASHIQSHALFTIKGDQCVIVSTDEDRVAAVNVTLSEVDGGDTQFTADPKNLQKLLGSSDSSETKFTYDPETLTLKVYASDNKKSFLSFASMDHEKFLVPSIGAQELEQTVIRELFLDGIKFANGYSTEKDEKYADVHIIDGVVYGANGNTRVGGYTSPDLAELPNMVVRRAMLSPIVTMIEKAEITEVAIKTSEKFITFHSPDGRCYFGFRKSTLVSPKFPISLKHPDLPKFNVDRAPFLKKLSRLSLTSWEDVGIKMSVVDGNLEMETVADRPSFESLPCVTDSEESIDFIIQCNKFKEVLGLFKASNIDIFIGKGRCTLYSDANLEIEEEGKDEPVQKEFQAAGLMTLARLVK